MLKSRAFTLIELLIVVAIIAILAAIAVPNFLEAQTRSKVSRVLSDMRSMATALETYAVDHNTYPPHGEVLSDGTNNFIGTAGGLSTIDYAPWMLLTTPISYITSRFDDPFTTDLESINPSMSPGFLADPNPFWIQGYSYINSEQMRIILLNKGFTSSANAVLPTYGYWRLYSAGPDNDKGWDTKKSVPYDPTNGTISNGDIIRSHARPEEKRAEDE